MKNNSYSSLVKGKVIVAFIVAGTALFLAWNVSKYTFKEMLGTVENVSAPNEKITLVSHLSRRITELDQLQRTRVLDRQTYNQIFFKEFGKIRLTLDSLGMLYKDNRIQINRIDSLKQLLLKRNALFLNYINVREKMVNNVVLTDQIQTINGLLLSRSEVADSAQILTKENKISTITTTTKSAAVAEEKQREKRFLGIFGRKKNVPVNTADTIVNEQLSITVDTIAVVQADSTLNEVKQAVQNIKKNQQQQSQKFLNREAELAFASNRLTRQMLGILQQVEGEVMAQAKVNQQEARDVVNAGVKHINLILITFLLLTAILLYFILSDISKSSAYRKQLELAKDEAEYHGLAKQRFLSNMSHEIRTPLQAIIGYAELMKNGSADKFNIDAIYHSSTHLLQLVNEILDYNRIISGKFAFNVSVFNLTDLLNEVVSVIRLSAKEKSLDLTTDFDLAPAEFVEGDAFRLKQILYNLLGNAIKFTDTGCITLNVSSKHHGGSAYLMIAVQDTGTGISDEDVKRIFHEFDQGELPGKNKVMSGSGLGLTIVKALVESQGGRIYVRSKPGKGSCFTLYLRFEVAAHKDAIKRDVHVGKSLFQRKVWVVDDDSFILKLCSTILQNNGIAHTCFNSAEKVLSTPWDDTVSCVLLDIRMAGMNGAELCSILRQKVPSPVKIYALTAQALPDERTGLLKLGFDGLLMKPFREEELVELINSGKRADTKTEESETNLESLRKMTFGDQEPIQKILNRFLHDSYNDMDELNAALIAHNPQTVTLLLHRIAGRTAQIGSKQIAADFRLLELASEKRPIDEAQVVKIKASIERLICLTMDIEKALNQIKEENLV